MNTDSDLSPQVYRQLFQDFIFSHDLLVDVKMLVPVVHTLTKLLANVMAAQICLYLEEERGNFFLKIRT